MVFTVGDIRDPAARKAAEGITVARAEQLVRDAVGDPDLEVHVEDVSTWVAACRAAESFQRGRVFLGGDAAHHMTPTGGYGGNTGIQDAHNIAWKLACVTRGQAGLRLLDTYDQERQPAGMQAIEQAYNRYVTRSDPDLEAEGMKPAIPDTHVEFNRYRSHAVIPDADLADDGAPDIDPRKSFARPGTRAPHVALRYAGAIISSLDLYHGSFTLMAGDKGEEWADAARQASEATRVAIAAHVVGRPGTGGKLTDMPPHRRKISSLFTPPFPAAHGVEPSGAVLVRPDGYVAWRSKRLAPAPAQELARAIETVLCR